MHYTVTWKDSRLS